MMTYDTHTFISPPRPEKKVPRSMLSLYEQLGWVAQVKKNGTYSVIYVSPEKAVSAHTRHGEDHKAWDWTPGSRRVFESFPGSGWYVLCAELMHSKVPGIRDINYVHDVLVYDGQYLVGKTYLERYGLLAGLFGRPTDARGWTRSHFVVDDHTWLARNLTENFSETFSELDRSETTEDEGLVLKNPAARLSAHGAGVGQVKCRRTHTNYSF